MNWYCGIPGDIDCGVVLYVTKGSESSSGWNKVLVDSGMAVIWAKGNVMTILVVSGVGVGSIMTKIKLNQKKYYYIYHSH